MKVTQTAAVVDDNNSSQPIAASERVGQKLMKRESDLTGDLTVVDETGPKCKSSCCIHFHSHAE